MILNASVSNLIIYGMKSIVSVLDKHNSFALKADLAMIKRGLPSQMGINVDIDQNFAVNLLLDWAEDAVDAIGAATGQVYLNALDDVLLAGLRQIVGKSCVIKSEPGFLHALVELAAYSTAFGQSALLYALSISQSELNDIIQTVADIADQVLTAKPSSHDETFAHFTAYTILISCRILIS